ncbi:MAG: lactate racemase domain-containing protein [Candidatus Bathyarchaeota archaeon]|nr:lactate racemase domain-containing protein [Candidatus Bathyarchaeota archaeon]
MVDVWLPYGATEVCVRIPTENLRNTIKAQDKDSLKNLEEEVGKAVRNPLGSKRLLDIIKPGDKVALALNISDPSLSKIVISSLISEVSQLGLKNDDFTVILTCNPFVPKKSSLFSQIRDEFSPLGVNVKIHDHFTSARAFIGEVEGGMKVYLNRDFAESPIKITASILEPNPYTLYNCSKFGVALGLSSMETIEGIFASALNIENLGETVFKSISSVSQSVKVDFNLEIVRNFRGDIVGVFAGGLEETLSEGIRTVDSLFKIQVEERTDVTVVSPGGMRFDRSIFSACGCLENALKVTKRNGVIILVAECSEGYGDIEMQKTVENFGDNIESLEKDLKKKFSISGFIAYRFLRALKRTNIFMASAIPDHYANKISRLKVFRVANDALKRALGGFERKPKISVIFHGNLVIPVVKEPEPKPA